MGLVLVEKLLAEGAVVIGMSRSRNLIEHSNFTHYQVDVGNEEAVIEVVRALTSKHKTIDILINNAGFGSYQKIEDTDSKLMRQMFETNVFGVFYLTKSIVPWMKKAGLGHIVNISSIAGITGIENMSVYNGTKFAVKGMSEALFKELRPHGIKVTCILPGSIGTNFFDDFEGYTPSKTMLNAGDVADSILFCLQSSASFHPVNLEIRPFHFANRSMR